MPLNVPTDPANIAGRPAATGQAPPPYLAQSPTVQGVPPPDFNQAFSYSAPGRTPSYQILGPWDRGARNAPDQGGQDQGQNMAYLAFQAFAKAHQQHQKMMSAIAQGQQGMQAGARNSPQLPQGGGGVGAGPSLFPNQNGSYGTDDLPPGNANVDLYGLGEGAFQQNRLDATLPPGWNPGGIQNDAPNDVIVGGGQQGSPWSGPPTTVPPWGTPPGATDYRGGYFWGPGNGTPPGGVRMGGVGGSGPALGPGVGGNGFYGGAPNAAFGPGGPGSIWYDHPSELR